MFLKDYWRDGRNLSHMYTHTCKCPHTAASRVLIQTWKCLFYWLECEQCRKKQQCVGMPLSEEKLKHNISESVALRKWKSDWSHQWAQIKRARGLADGDVAGKWKRKQDGTDEKPSGEWRACAWTQKSFLGNFFHFRKLHWERVFFDVNIRVCFFYYYDYKWKRAVFIVSLRKYWCAEV